MTGLRNLALNKPAIQSSICEHSIGATCELDAAIAVSGDLESRLTFHTDREPNPWWEVDLEEWCEISAIIISNRHPEQQRLQNFTILHSTDHKTWTASFRKCDPRVFGDIEIPFIKPIIARYIRVRLDKIEFFHLSQVQILGSSDIGRERQHETQSRRVLFSVLYNESPEFLKNLIDNFVTFTDEQSVFVINFPASYPMQSCPPSFSDRVVLFQAPNDRFVTGHTILLGHLQSFQHATSLFGAFDYFVPLASNCLFFRRFVPKEAEDNLRKGPKAIWHVPKARLIEGPEGVSVDAKEWHYERIAHQSAFLRFLRQGDLRISELVPMQIEGLFAPAAQWGLLAGRATQIEEWAKYLDPHYPIPVEEILPATFFHHFHDGNFVSICQVLWHPFRSMVGLEEIIQPELHFPPHVFIAKWFERDLRRPETAAVATSRGRDLVELISQHLRLDDIDDLLEYRHLLDAFARSIELLAVSRQTYRIRA